MPMGICAVALSGGVDSSVACLLLQREGQRLVGASHIIWPASRCCSPEVLQRARALCQRLSVPYRQVDLVAEFSERVVDRFVSTYLSGRTPNPCVDCNRFIRFELFYRRLEQLLRQEGLLHPEEPLFLSTGHYVRLRHTQEGLFLAKARDPDKDQSYMLYRIKKELLPRLIFPLGDYLKQEVMELAAGAGLEYTWVKESQDACFVDSDYVDFIRGQLSRGGAAPGEVPGEAPRETPREVGTPSPDWPGQGEIVDPEGRLLGHHRGYLYYTVGQRRGLGLGNGPWYVARIEPQHNRLVVDRREGVERSSLLVEDLNWFIEPPSGLLSCQVKLRYQSDTAPCRIEPAGKGMRVILRRGEIVTPGQSAVFYDHDLVLGGGTIQ